MKWHCRSSVTGRRKELSPPPLFFELEGGDEVTMNRVRMALAYLAEVINRMDKP